MEKSTANWREWWMRNEWRFLGHVGVRVKSTGGCTAMERDSWHVARIREFLLAAMEDRYRDVRASAAIALGKLGQCDESVREALERAAREGDPEVEKSAILALGMVRCRVSIPFLHNLLKRGETRAHRRAAAAVALGLMRDPATIHDLAKRTERSRERKSEVRAAAVVGLGLVREERAAAVLIRILFGSDKKEIRALAASALANSGLKRVRMNCGRKRQIVHVSRVFENFLARKSIDGEIRRSVALGLGKLGDARSAPFLMRAARSDRDEIVRGFAYLALGELVPVARKGGNIEDFLLRSANIEKDAAVKPYLILALGLSRNPGCAPILRRAFLKGNPEVRGASAVALGLIASTASVKMLGEELAHPRSVSDVRWYCCQGLGLIGGREARTVLRRAVETGAVPYIQAAACKGLAVLSDRTTIPLLVGNLSSKNRVVRTWAVRSLGYFRDTGTVPRIIELVDKENSAETRALAVVSLGAIAEDWDEMPVLRRISDHCNWIAARRYKTLALFLRML